MTTPEVFDITSKRAERAKSRAAKREGRGETLEVRFEGDYIAMLQAEFPVDVLAPLQDINLDLALLVRQVVELSATTDATERATLLGTVVDVLAANPDLPAEVIEAIKEMGRRLFGEDGYAMLVSKRPTPWDLGSLATYLMNWFGISLGESSGSSTSSTDGVTSNSTSKDSVSTPETSGGSPAIPASSESDVSPA